YHLDEARVQDDATALDRSRDEEKRLLGLRRRFVNPVGKANVHWFHDDTCAQGEDLLRRCIRGGGRRGERPSGHTTGTGDAGSPQRRRPGTSERARLCALEKPRVTGRDPRENRLNRPAKAERVARSSRVIGPHGAPSATGSPGGEARQHGPRSAEGSPWRS